MPKTAAEIALMSDEDLVAAADAGELDEVDGSDPGQRGEEGGEEAAGEEGAAVEEPGETPADEEEEEEEAGEEATGDEIVLAGVKYTPEQYEALMSALEDGQRAVPQSRLMEESTKRREAEQRNRQMELQIARQEGAAEALTNAEKKAREAIEAAKPKFDISAARKEYHQLLKDEEWDKAEALSEKIDTERDRIEEARRVAAIEESKAESQRSIRIVENRRIMESVANAMFAKYPFLNHEGKESDETAILAVQALRNRLFEEGDEESGFKPYPMAAALRKAMTKIGDSELKKRGGKARKDPKSETETARRAAALRKALKASNGQPPRLGGTGNRAGKPGGMTEKDIRSMTDEEFAAADKRGELGDGKTASQRARA